MAQELIKSVFEDSTIFKSGNSHASFGKLLSDLHHEQVYLQAVMDCNTTNPLITEWLSCYEKHCSLPSIQYLFGSGILSLENTYFKPRFLLDDGSILDTQNSLIHTILSSNENINVVIVDDGTGANKKDVGLYSLEYGNAYVASICPVYSYSKAVQALKEANDFVGPSIVILYSPKLETQDSLKSIQIAKDQIESGKITLYRYTPRHKLDVDSTKPKSTLEKFLKKQNDLSLMVQHQKQHDIQLVENIDKLVLQSAKDSYQKLFGKMNRKKLVVLYGSDGSNGKSLAKRIGLEAKEKGLLVKVLAMDEFNHDELVNEKHVLFVVSTAGQGEFPSNARETWKFLQKTDLDLGQTSYSVFALGDRHYWPREEDKHFFCKAGKDLDLKLKKLGAKQLADIGLGDDRDPDGYFTAFADWAPLVWESLGVDVGAVVTGDAIPTDDAIKAASNYLRGTIAEGLLDESTGQLYEWDTKLTKFHGIYQQDDRDLREHRARKGMEKAFSFMIRVRVPGGVATAAQYLAMDDISDKWANSTIKLTTRQAFQFHGVFKSVLKKTIQDINHSLLGNLKLI
jgi:sulfite reductase (NADPH) hemoprotein beta-component